MTVRMVMLGRQGSGKGTQCARVAERFGIVHVSTGDMLRSAVRQSTPVGRAVKEVIEQGGLVDDELMASLVQGRLGEDDTRTAGWVLDGFPRTLGQAVSLDRISEARPVNCVINLDVPKDIVLARLTVRREAEQRSDDSPEAVARRLELYETQTAPLIEYYEHAGKLRVVDGVGSMEEVFDRLCRAITEATGIGA
ncbi:MAG: adenylate kinase [Ilumatobacteraceae bacterium]